MSEEREQEELIESNEIEAYTISTEEEEDSVGEWVEEGCSKYPFVVVWPGGLNIRPKPSLKV